METGQIKTMLVLGFDKVKVVMGFMWVLNVQTQIWKIMGLSIPMRSLRSKTLILRTNITTPKVPFLFFRLELYCCQWMIV